MYALPAPGGSFQYVDAAGQPVPTPPGTIADIGPTGLPEIRDTRGNLAPAFYPPPGKPPLVWPP
jgi:hypothetical protein